MVRRRAGAAPATSARTSMGDADVLVTYRVVTAEDGGDGTIGMISVSDVTAATRCGSTTTQRSFVPPSCTRANALMSADPVLVFFTRTEATLSVTVPPLSVSCPNAVRV